jgi:alpha-pyrone synthase
MVLAYLNRIGTAVPPHDVHRKFVASAPLLLGEPRLLRLFERMAERAGIEHRYSFLEPSPDPNLFDAGGFYQKGRFPDTATRMRFFEDHAFRLARQALEDLGLRRGDRVTHLVTACCTGFYAPGLDWQIVEGFGLDRRIERTSVGFMGCQAAMNALKLARHIVRSEPDARVLVLNIELSTLHFQDTQDLEQVLSFLVFGDGCAASLVSAEPHGIALDAFATALLPNTADLISWRIGGHGFDMRLAGEVPLAIQRGVPESFQHLASGRRREDFALWAVHPGGRSVLDGVERGLGLPPHALDTSRAVLRDFGNMSSPTIVFVLKEILSSGADGAPGCTLAFGPGLTAEGLVFTLRR